MTVVLCGTSVTLFVWGLWSLFAEAKQGESKAYRDEPPQLFKLLWALVLVMSELSSAWIKPSNEAQILWRLKNGGVDYALTPKQFFGGKLAYGLIAMLMGLLVASQFDFSNWLGLVLGLMVGFWYPDYWLIKQIKRRQLALLKALPFFLEMVTLAVESGLNLAGAIQKAAAQIPPGPLSYEMNQVMRDVRAGRPRVDALRDLSARLQFAPMSSLVSAMVQGELTGSSLGPVLRAQAMQRRSERFARAEKMAMEAPVRILGPLILFIFPCTFIVIGFPIVVKFLASGL